MSASSVIIKYKDQIIKSWSENIKEEIPELTNHSKSAIQTNVPHFLDALIEELEADDVSKILYHSEEHGKQRINFKEYSLRHIVKEYHLLRREIFTVLDKEHKILPSERNHINYSIDKAIEETGETFHQMETEKILSAQRKAEENLERLKSDDEARENFVSSLTHDLSSPIKNIKGAFNFLKNDTGLIKKEELFNIVELNIQKAEQLIKDLLDTNLINSGAKLPVDLQECNLVELIKNELAEFFLRHKNRIHIKTDSENLITKVDPAYMSRAISNLVDNAVKYGDSEKPITLAINRWDGQILLSVHNYGEPIPLEKQAHIFQRYSGEGSSDNMSWGIGLSLVKGIAEAHGGKITLESARGYGTKFTIAIPAIKENHLHSRQGNKQESSKK